MEGYYAETKVYFDGSHYVGIPKQNNNVRYVKMKKRKSIPYEGNSVLLDNDNNITDTELEKNIIVAKNGITLTEVELVNGEFKEVYRKKKGVKRISQKEIFEEVYKEYCNYSKKKIKSEVMNKLCTLFPNDKKIEEFVDKEIRKKIKNKAVRRIRCFRKAGLQTWNYFCTFTYDDNKQSEESFRKKLSKTLSNFSSRKGWKYIGVWERGEGTNRLHFHCLLSVPKGTLSGELKEVKDYDTRKGKMQIAIENSFFKKNFGRNDFKEIGHEQEIEQELSYILKYIEKSGERIVYSKHLPTFFISDILEKDVVGTYGEYEMKKLVLFDTFLCIDMGEIIGVVSKKIIQKMRYAY